MMLTPLLNLVPQVLGRALRRFPLFMLSAIVTSSIFGFLPLVNAPDAVKLGLIHTGLVLTSFMILSLSISLRAEHLDWNRKHRLRANTVVTALGISYWCLCPEPVNYYDLYTTIALTIAFAATIPLSLRSAKIDLQVQRSEMRRFIKQMALGLGFALVIFYCGPVLVALIGSRLFKVEFGSSYYFSMLILLGGFTISAVLASGLPYPEVVHRADYKESQYRAKLIRRINNYGILSLAIAVLSLCLWLFFKILAELSWHLDEGLDDEFIFTVIVYGAPLLCGLILLFLHECIEHFYPPDLSLYTVYCIRQFLYWTAIPGLVMFCVHYATVTLGKLSDYSSYFAMVFWVVILLMVLANALPILRRQRSIAIPLILIVCASCSVFIGLE